MNKPIAEASVLGLVCAGAAVGFMFARVLLAERQALSLPVRRELPESCPTIVVFGARAYPTGPSPELLARLEHGRLLLEQELADVIVVSGGIDGAIDEVDIMSRWLQDQGVPSESIIEGRPGSNTRETMNTLRRLTVERNLSPYFAVSSRYHSRRIRDEARRLGLDVVATGPVASPETNHPRTRIIRIVSEMMAIAYYRLPVGLAARVNTNSGSWRHRLPAAIARVGD